MDEAVTKAVLGDAALASQVLRVGGRETAKHGGKIETAAVNFVYRLAGHAVAIGRAAGRPAADAALPTAHHGAHAADQGQERAAAIVYSRLPS